MEAYTEADWDELRVSPPFAVHIAADLPAGIGQHFPQADAKMSMVRRNTGKIRSGSVKIHKLHILTGRK